MRKLLALLLLLPALALGQPYYQGANVTNATGLLTPSHGGTGVANTNTKTITLGGPLVTSGAFTTTITSTATTNVTLPTSGTLSINAGTATNDSATAGDKGEYLETVQSTPTNCPTSTQYGDLASRSLTAGDWDVTGIAVANLNGATMTNFTAGISTTTGNSSTGLVVGSNRGDSPPPTSAANITISIPNYRVSLSSTTTVFLKYECDFSAGTPQARGRISARRVR